MNERILLIDDEPALQMTIGDRLRKHGYAVDCARDGEEGVEKARQTQFDLIILDMILPSKDRLSLCQEIRETGATAPILQLTALSHPIVSSTSLRVGTGDYLPRPFHMDELVVRVEELLHGATT